MSDITKTNNFIMYTTKNGSVNVQILVDQDNETIWLNQKQLAELFNVNLRTINEHINNIFDTNELTENSTIRKFRIVQMEGNREVERNIQHYNLDMIIAVGYRINSYKATQFRIWSTRTLREFIIKGFVLDDERLKQGNNIFNKDYFDELLERVRSIRASERRIYQKITDIFAECSIDYNKNSMVARQFYANVQDKFHYAITGQTSSEKIYNSADSRKPYMGLTNFKNSPEGRIIKSDTIIGKNYLGENEIKKLERTISGFFDYIEGIIERNKDFTMEKFTESVNKFLEFNEYKVLDGYGNINRKQAEHKAHIEYEKYKPSQDIAFKSDFDKISSEIVHSNKIPKKKKKRLSDLTKT